MANAHVGRNDPCPCGSGKRYKECHGSLDAVRREADLARAQFGSGLVQESVASARRALALDARDVDAWNVLGLGLETTEPEAALAAWERAIALSPRQPEAHFRAGDFHRRRQEFEAAIAAYRNALALAPDHAVANNNMGLALQQLGQYDEAERHYRAAIAGQPGMVQALANLGDLCQATDRFAEAISWFARALTLNPNLAELWSKSGICQHRQGGVSDAQASFERALSLEPENPGYLINLASVLLAQFRHAEAAPLIEKALQVRPEFAEAQNMLLYVNQHTCRWEGFDRLFEAQRARLAEPGAPAVVPHNLVSLPYTSAELLTASRKWVRRHIRPKPASPPVLTVPAGDRLRIAYLGGDFRAHPLASLLTEVIEKHDRTRFEVVGYSYGPDDASPARARFARAFDRFVDIRAESIADTAQRIRDDRIGILFDTSGYVLHARSEIFALRAAPIQINCIGFPGTLGADFYDYILTDSFVTPPDQQAHFAERFMLLPHCYMPGDTKRAMAPVPTRAQCGLPERGVVFCCFNASYKILSEVFGVWMRILAKVPGSVLWMLESDPMVWANLRREAQRHDVTADRLIFAPRVPLALHLARHNVADLFLDTLPCNAHTTANDALFAGLPVLTCAGETFAGRVSGSHLHAIGLPELVTDNLDDYGARALELAQDPALLASYRSRLRANRDRYPLFDTAGYTRALETRLSEAWDEAARRNPNQ